MLAERTDALIGGMLGKDYRVLEPIGAGGMAVVYLVEHQTLLKRFAAKVLSIELASSLEARARFTEEAHAASQLDHENIVSISDFGVTVDQRPFFVMELLRGQTLDQRLGDGPMAIEEVVAVSVPVARALAHAHAEGVVHRDIKPENIFLVQRSQGRWGVKVVDFGIAKTTPALPRLTRTKPTVDETFGSPLFMAPEMIRGEDESVDARTDVYSFGVVLYRMLCGRLPFDDENLLKVMQMHLSLPVPSPRDANPALSPELAAVVERALAKHREDRYPSMDALLLDLEAALSPGSDRLLIEAQSGTALGETPFAAALALPRLDPQRPRTPSSAPPPSPERPAAPRRSRAPLVLAIAAVAVAVIGVIGWRRTTGRLSAAAAVDGAPRPPPATAPTPAPPGEVAPATVAAIRPEPARDGEVAPAPEPPPAAGPAALAELEPAVAAVPVPVRRLPPHPLQHAVAAAPRSRRPAFTAPSLSVKKHTIKTTDDLGKGVEISASDTTNVTDVVDRSDSGRANPPAAEPAPAPTGSTESAAAASRLPPSAPPSAPPAAPAAPAAPVPAPAPAVKLAPAAPRGPSASGPVASPGSPGSFDATPEVVSFEVQGSLSPAVVRRGVDRALPALRACYGAAARAGRATPAADLQLSFEIDENSLATHIAVGGARLGSLPGCAAGVASQIRTSQAPDIGTVKVAVVIHFRPTGR